MSKYHIIIIGIVSALGAAFILDAASVWPFKEYAKTALVYGKHTPSMTAIVRDGRVDHGLYNRLLKRYVDETGFVDYKTWKTQDENTLNTYLEAVGHVNPAQLRDRRERLAFWINVYNALTIKAILHFYPTKSIRDHVSLLVGYNVWKDFKWTINGQDYSLDEIEHDILRKMGEPRIHFAIVCASIGCPPLRNEAYTGERLEAQLTANTNAFFADPQKFRIDTKARTVYVSPILDWFKEDFGKNQEERLAFIRPYVPEAVRGFLSGDGWTVRYLDYDWGLNERSPQRTGS